MKFPSFGPMGEWLSRMTANHYTPVRFRVGPQYRGVEQWQLGSLISFRSPVRIGSPQLIFKLDDTNGQKRIGF